MEGAVLTSSSNARFRSHLKNAASVLCARTLPKQRRNASVVTSTTRHHTYPRTTPQKRVPISCRAEAAFCDQTHKVDTKRNVPEAPLETNKCSLSTVKFKGSISREVANAWGCRVGQPEQPAPADRVQSLFNDIELYPTKTQVFEMLVCARQCARRKSLVLTFGEFCVFAAELRRCSRQARQTSNKPESPQSTGEQDVREKEFLCKHRNGSEASPTSCEVFLGGSCNPTTWRIDIAIPMLKQMGITYFNPQVDDWSSELVEVEYRAKAEARALLFVLDSETRTVATCVEAAHLAAAPRDLLLVLRPYTRHQTIGGEKISDHEYVELSRARATLQEAVERRGLPAFSDIPAALRCARAVLRGARTHPHHSLGHTILRLKRAYDAAGGRNTKLPRTKAVDALKELTRTPRELVDRLVPTNDTVDFEAFCAAVAELAGTADNRNGVESEVSADTGARERVERGPEGGLREGNGRNVYNARLRAYGRKLGLFIPKNGGTKTNTTESGGGSESSDTSAASDAGDVFTPGTERRLQRLPAMLGAPTHDVYLAGCFPCSGPRPEELLRASGVTHVSARANDYTRMFSAPARRSASAHPDKPRHDKKPRQELSSPEVEEVQFRDRSTVTDTNDRLSASDFYSVTEDVTPQPFKGTYDEDLLLGSKVLLFSMSAGAPCFAAMVLAAHYMGLRPNTTVLLVQPMDRALAPHYSEAAIKDYNRGRHYLIDLARRSGVPVFDNVEAAVTCAVSRLRAASIH